VFPFHHQRKPFFWRLAAISDILDGILIARRLTRYSRLIADANDGT
jgi:hypothetical protein